MVVGAANEDELLVFLGDTLGDARRALYIKTVGPFTSHDIG
jgi:hypothetical protein